MTPQFPGVKKKKIFMATGPVCHDREISVTTGCLGRVQDPVMRTPVPLSRTHSAMLRAQRRVLRSLRHFRRSPMALSCVMAGRVRRPVVACPGPVVWAWLGLSWEKFVATEKSLSRQRNLYRDRETMKSLSRQRILYRDRTPLSPAHLGWVSSQDVSLRASVRPALCRGQLYCNNEVLC